MTNIEFLSAVKLLIGAKYEKVDCIGVISKSLSVKMAGTNWLFRSINNSNKYKYLIERHACGDGTTPPPGAVVFMTDETKVPKGYKTGPDAYHCGVVDNDGYVIHSSPKTGVRKDMSSRWTKWDYWGLMKQVDYAAGVSAGDNDENDSSDAHDYCETLTDRDLLEAIYRAVVKD